MNARLLLTLLWVAALAPGCVSHEESGGPTSDPPPSQPEESGVPVSNPPPPLPGNVKFSLTFGGLIYFPYYTTIRVAMPGKPFVEQTWGFRSVDGDGVGGALSVTLQDLAPGTYLYEAQGRTWMHVVEYDVAGTFTVNGDQLVIADLVPTSAAEGSYVTLSWTFPDNASCAQAGVDSVDVTIVDGRVDKTVTAPCWKGQMAEGLTTQYVLPGNHTIKLVARDANGAPLYYYDGQFTTVSRTPFHVSYSLYRVGGAG